MYSQSEEEKYILEFFKGKPAGRLLEIGAYHPTVFSNSRALIELGWSGVLVEPSPKCFKAIAEFYEDSSIVEVVNVAIGEDNSELPFYDSAGAVGTALEQHYKAWEKVQLDYEKILVNCVSWLTFYQNFPGIFDFVSIDTEGMDYTILNQMDLEVMETKLLCVEYSYNNNKIFDYLMMHGFQNIIYKNNENIIVSKV